MSIKIPIEKIRILHPLDVYEMMQIVLKREEKLDKGKEHLWVVSLDAGSRILSLELVSMGSKQRTVVEPTEILSIPLYKNAAGIMLIHNHPSGRPEPSKDDEEMTDRMIQACRLVNVPVLDHVIIAEHSYYSFKASGLLDRLEASLNYVPPYEIERQAHEDGREEGKEEGRKEGIAIGEGKRALEIARQMFKMDMDLEMISKVTGLSKKSIQTYSEPFR